MKGVLNKEVRALLCLKCFILRNYRNFITQQMRDSWYCYILATDPNHQKQGLATEIVESVFRKVRSNRHFLDVFPLISRKQASAVGKRQALCSLSQKNVSDWL